MDGVLEPAGDRWRLRFTRTLHHAPDKVWRALTDPEQLSAWFPQRIDADWTVGAPLRFVSAFGDFDGRGGREKPCAVARGEDDGLADVHTAARKFMALLRA